MHRVRPCTHALCQASQPPPATRAPVQGRRLRAALLASFAEVFVREPGCKYLSGDKRVVGGERGHTPTSRRVAGKTSPLIRLLKNKLQSPHLGGHLCVIGPDEEGAENKEPSWT